MRRLHLLVERRVLGLLLSVLSLAIAFGTLRGGCTETVDVSPTGVAAGDLVVIVNKASTVMTLSSRDLRSIFLGTKDSWPDGKKITAVSLPIERPETQLLLKEICGMSESDFKRYFLMMNFQGKLVSPPRMLPTPGALRAYVRNTQGALGAIRGRDVDSSVTVVSIDGLSPGAPGYKLAMSH